MSTRSLGSLTLDIIARTGNLQQGMDRAARTVDQRSRQMGQSLSTNVSRGVEDASRNIENLVARFASIGAVVAGLGLVVRESIRAEQAQAQLTAILRSTGEAAGLTADELNRMAREMSQTSVFSTTEITNAQTRLLSYSGILGENIPRAMQAVIDQSARLGISVEQSAETIGRALESPARAAAALAQQGFGAAFTEEVRSTIQALVDAGREAEAQVMILEILEESYEGAARAMRDTLGGALRGLRNDFMEMLVGPAGESRAAMDALAGAVNLLSQNLPVATAALTGFAATQIGRQLASRLVTIRETQAALVAQTRAEVANAQAIELKARAAVLDAQAEVRRAQAIGGSVSVSSQAAAATLAHRQALIALEQAQLRAAAAAGGLTAAMRGVLGFFGGPVGLAAMVAITAGSWLLFRDRTDDARKALIDFSDAQERVIENFRVLNTEQRSSALLDLSRELQQAESEVNLALDRILTAPRGTIGGEVWRETRQEIDLLRDQFRSGAIDADTLSNRVADAARQMLEAGGQADRLGDKYVELLAGVANAAREVDRQRGSMAALTEVNRELENATDASTEAMRRQAAQAAGTADSVEEYLSRARQELVRGSQQLARLQGGTTAELRRSFGQYVLSQGGVEAFTPEQLREIVAVYRRRRDQLQQIEGAEEARRSTRGGSRGRSEAQRAAEELIRRQQQISDAQRGWSDRLLDMQSVIDGPVAQSHRNYESQLSDLNQAFHAGEVALSDYILLQEVYLHNRDEEIKRANELRTPYERMLEDLEFEFDLIGMTNREREIAIAQRWAEVDATSEQGQRLAELVTRNMEYEESMRSIVEAQDAVRDGAAGFFTDAMTGAKSFKDAALDALNSIHRRLSQMVAEQLVEQLFGQRGDSGGGAAGGWMAAIFGGLFGGGRANGGWAAANRMFEVNERGLEMATVGGRDYMLTGNQPVKITPNHQLPTGRSVAVTNNYYNPVLADRRSEQRIAQEQAMRQRTATVRG